MTISSFLNAMCFVLWQRVYAPDPRKVADANATNNRPSSPPLDRATIGNEGELPAICAPYYGVVSCNQLGLLAEKTGKQSYLQLETHVVPFWVCTYIGDHIRRSRRPDMSGVGSFNDGSSVYFVLGLFFVGESRGLRMKNQTPAQVLRIYLGEEDRAHGAPLYAEVVMRLKELGIAGVTVYHGREGYGAHRQLHTGRLESLFFDLPIIIEAVDVSERIKIALAALDDMITEGLVTVQEVEAIRYMKDPNSDSAGGH
jgi:PII-like signaling protein